MLSNDSSYLQLAIKQAQESVREGGFPAGAVIVTDDTVIAKAISTGFIHNDPSGHAESVAMRDACNVLNTVALPGGILYASLEPCVMCFSTAYWAGISKIVYACRKTPDMVDKQYYEGKTDNQQLNRENNRQIEYVHVSEEEQSSRAVVVAWEKQGGFKVSSKK